MTINLILYAANFVIRYAESGDIQIYTFLSCTYFRIQRPNKVRQNNKKMVKNQFYYIFHLKTTFNEIKHFL